MDDGLFSKSVTMKHAVYFHCWVGDTVGTQRANLIDFLACGLTSHNGTDTGKQFPQGGPPRPEERAGAGRPVGPGG